jgi:hypothetical protein
MLEIVREIDDGHATGTELTLDAVSIGEVSGEGPSLMVQHAGHRMRCWNVRWKQGPARVVLAFAAAPLYDPAVGAKGRQQRSVAEMALDCRRGIAPSHESLNDQRCAPPRVIRRRAPATPTQ